MSSSNPVPSELTSQICGLPERVETNAIWPVPPPVGVFVGVNTAVASPVSSKVGSSVNAALESSLLVGEGEGLIDWSVEINIGVVGISVVGV